MNMGCSIEVISNFLLKPSPANHRFVDQCVPFTIFDRAAASVYVPILFIYPSPMPDDASMVEGIAKALFYFPHLAGRLGTDKHGRPSIHVNDAGARIILTRIDSSLEEKLPLPPSSELQELHPSSDEVEELLHIQLNRFACGGVVIGLTAHHRVADGQSMNNFFTAWVRLVRGLEPEWLPYHDRQGIAWPRNPPNSEFNHRAIEFKAPDAEKETSAAAVEETPNIVVRYSAEFMSKLKSRFISENPTRRYSTFQCLLAYVWKKLTLTRGLAAEETTHVRVAVNGRMRMKPKVPMDYFGNLVLWAYPSMSVEQLLSRSYGEVADAIHAAVSAVDDGYFKSFVDFGAIAAAGEGAELLEASAPLPGATLSPNVELDSWLSFQYHELDFGGGGPVQVLTYLPIEGLGIFLPAPDEKGAVDFLVALHPEQVSTFKKIAYDLD